MVQIYLRAPLFQFFIRPNKQLNNNVPVRQDIDVRGRRLRYKKQLEISPKSLKKQIVVPRIQLIMKNQDLANALILAFLLSFSAKKISSAGKHF